MIRSALMALALVAAFGHPAEARTAVALLLEAKGAARPAVEAYAEFEAGQSVRLENGASIQFLHYATCEIVTVKGGELSFSEQRYALRGGLIAEVRRSKCPTTVTLRDDQQIGGAVLRSIPDPRAARLTTRPGFVLVGADRSSYRKLRIRRGAEILFEGELADYRFEWPKDRAPLEAGDDYTLELLSGSGAARSVAFRVEERRGSPPLTVMRVD